MVRLAERLRELPEPCPPRIPVGGHAVEAGLTASILGAEIVLDISALGFERTLQKTLT